jgi:hypothetical protein
MGQGIADDREYGRPWNDQKYGGCGNESEPEFNGHGVFSPNGECSWHFLLDERFQGRRYKG